MIRKNVKQFILLFLWPLLFLGCQKKEVEEVPALLPKPVKVTALSDGFSLTKETPIVVTSSTSQITEIAQLLKEAIQKHTGLDLKITNQPSKKAITIGIKNLKNKNPEAYSLNVMPDGITIEGNQPSGIFYGTQTFRQLLPLSQTKKTEMPGVSIEDYPRLRWRGLHLDVGRHFFTKEEVKRYLDLMALYKLNVFHWHLTEDQGWRIEIKKYPKLTSVGAWREKVGFKNNQEKGLNKDEGKPYGGFYTQEEVKEIVEYARQRSITVLPEIEMPGHSMAALTSYPELYCFPKEKLHILTEGGVSDGVYCAGKEETFKFLEDVLTEILDLFPSKYIHIGGDEAPKRNWQKCPLCQKRIKQEGLHNEHELQSYFIKRIEKFLNNHGRQLVGWDEILEGGVTKTATIMSWRGITPGMEAAQMGNDVVMTPGTPTYISRPQSINPVTKHTGAVTTMRDLYEFNPVPKELTPEQTSHIIGVQACQWSEGTPNLEILEYKVYPRAIALAEIGWTPQEDRHWDDFYKRITSHLPFLSFYDVKYGQRSYDVRINLIPGPDNKKVFAEFKTEVPDSIFYTLNGSEPTKTSTVYNGKLEITKSGTIRTRMYRPDGSAGKEAVQKVFFHKAIGKKVHYNISYSAKHDGGGDYALTNGLLKKWQGYEKRNVDLVMDLGEITSISKIRTQWWYDLKDWVFKPLEVTYEISDDGDHYTEVYRFTYQTPDNKYEKGILPLEKILKETKARYIRLKAKNIMQNPQWHGSAGGASWIFVDELVVE